MNLVALLGLTFVGAQATVLPSQREVNGFYLGQYKEVLTKHFGKPENIMHTEDNWEQRIYVLSRPDNAYMIFEFAPSAPDTIYAIQITGPANTKMLAFGGLMLGAKKDDVFRWTGKPTSTKVLEDIGGEMASWEGRNFTLEFNPSGLLSSIRIVGYRGLDGDQDKEKADLHLFELALKRRELDYVLETLCPDVEIFRGGKTVIRFALPARREVNDPKSVMYKALFGGSKGSVNYALSAESTAFEEAFRLRDNGVIDKVFKWPKGKLMKEVVFKFHAGKWRVWEIALR